MSANIAAHMSKTSFTNVRIWDGVSASYRDDADAVVIDADRIVAVGTTADVAPADRVDCGGLTVLPGLIDAHVHMVLDPEIMAVDDQLSETHDVMREKMRARAARMVANGITTARDLGGGDWLELELRDAIARGETPGPRLVCAGQPVTSIKGHCHFWNGEAADVDAAVEVIDRQAAHAVDLIKVMASGGNLTRGSKPQDAQWTSDELTAIVGHANARGYDVAAHAHGTAGIKIAVEAGVNTVEHCSWYAADGQREAFDVGLAETMAAEGIWISPTINAGWQRFGEAFRTRIKANLAGMRATGCRLIASTDAGIPRVKHHDLPIALAVFADYADLSPLETLRAATHDCAEAIGLGNVTGVIQPGWSADLLFVEGDPLADLAALTWPVRVIANGRPIEPETRAGRPATPKSLDEERR